jgi:2-polyprenyl-6-methoxyphenol hydroxylase-like FAD-dependent oxidoreductase
MTPNLGQGACMAIEDAVVLAKEMTLWSDVSKALRSYEERRAERTGTVVETARRFGRMGQWANPFVRAVRDAMMHAVPNFVTERQLRWLYQFDV